MSLNLAGAVALKESLDQDETVKTLHASQKIIKRPIFSALWQSGARFVGLLTAILTNAILARSMSRADFGRYVLIASIVLILACIGRLGLERVIVRYITKALAEGNNRLYWQAIFRGYGIACLSTLLTIATWSFSMVLADQWLLGWEVSKEMVLISGACIGLGSFLMVSAESFRAIGHQGLANICAAEVSSPFISGAQILILLAVIGSGSLGLEHAFLTLASAMAIPGVVAMLFLPRLFLFNAPTCEKPKLMQSSSTESTMTRHDANHLGGEVSFVSLIGAGFQTMLAQLVTYLMVLADLYFAGRFCSPEDFGLYAAAKRLANIASIPMSVVITSASATIAVMFAKGETIELQRVLQRLAVLGCIPTFLLVAVYLIFPSQIMAGLFGAQYSAGAYILMVLSLGYVALACAGGAEMTLVMTGNQVWALWISFFGLVSLLLCIALFSVWDKTGIAIAISFSAMFSMRSALMWLTAKLRTNIWTNPFWRSS